MTRDRLAELRRKQAALGVGDQQHDDQGDSTSGGGVGRNHHTGNGASYNATDGNVVIEMDRLNVMDRFFEQVEDLRKLIEEAKADVRRVKAIHSDVLSQPIPDEKKKQELDNLMSTIKTSSLVIRAKVKDMEKGIKQEEEEVKKDETPAALRIKKTQHSSLLREFVEVMNDYQKAQVDYRDRCKARIKRQLNIAESDYTEDEVESMIEEGDFSVFTQSILRQSEQSKQTLADVQDRHNDIMKLEKSLRELHELFMEMANMVESQGEVIDRIETQVLATRDYTESAREQLRQAEVLQTKARKKKIWIIIIVIIILIIMALIIYFSLP